MAILLEGINIPEGNPITINIYRDGTWVNAYTTEDGNAIEVSEPHGRLGDLTSIEAQLDYIANLDWNKQVGASGGMLAALEVVEDAPTVIPASDDGE